jgi:RimJ/RimL family protein N-acetyltransferase
MRLIKLNEGFIKDIIRMENNSDTSEFIISYNHDKHIAELKNPLNSYLGIYENGRLLGFFIIGIENEGKRIEFRRIVIEKKGLGYGQKAIIELENYCTALWNTDTIWLDVFDYNQRGIHIYKKLGYKTIGEKLFGDRKLIIMEKKLIK